MAFVVKIANDQGDGAGRSRYLLKDPEKVLSIRTNALSPVALAPTPELYPELANDFDKNLLARQKDYRTDHFVISFQHRFTQEEIDEILDILEEEFTREFGEDRLFLAVVHAEEFRNITPEQALEQALEEEKLPLSSACNNSAPIKGTAFHIVLGRNTEGRGIRLGKKEYMNFKKRVAGRLQKFANEREREVFQHFLEGKRERAFYKKGELYKPLKNEKVWAKKILKDITTALENGDVEKAVEILNQHNAEIETFEIAPYNKQKLKEPTPYIILPRLNGDGMFAMRLKKAERVLYERYKTAFERVRDESQRVSRGIEELSRGIREDLERIGEIENPEKGIRIQTPKPEKIRRVREELERVTSEFAEELGIDRAELEQQLRLIGGEIKRDAPILEERDRDRDREQVKMDKERDREFEREPESEDMGRGVRTGIDIHNDGFSSVVREENGNVIEENRECGEQLEEYERKHSEGYRRTIDNLGEQVEDRVEFSEIGDAERECSRVKSGGYKLKDGGYEYDALDHNDNAGDITDSKDTGIYSRIFAIVGTETLVIADDKKVIERLVSEYDAEGYKEIEVDEIPELWEKGSYRGTVYLYMNDLERKREVEEKLRKASRTEKEIAPWLKQKWEIVEIKPVGIEIKRYWRKKDSVIFEEDIRENPGLYRNDEVEEIRQIAISQLKALKRKQELAKKMAKQKAIQKNRDSGFDLSL